MTRNVYPASPVVAKRGEALDAETIAKLRNRIRTRSAALLAREWEVSPEALVRALAGLPVLAGTRALIERGLSDEK